MYRNRYTYVYWSIISRQKKTDQEMEAYEDYCIVDIYLGISIDLSMYLDTIEDIDE